MQLRQDDATQLADVAYLSRSRNRVQVLEALAAGGATRDELQSLTDASRATLSRVLGELVERGWATREGRQYRATHLGAFVAREFDRLLDRLAVVPVLSRVEPWLPEEGFGFDLDRLATADVVATTPTDVLAPTTFLVRQLRAASRVRVLSHAMLTSGIQACHGPAVAGEQRIEAVVPQSVVDAIAADPEVAVAVREMVAAGTTDLYCVDGDVPYVLVLTDDEVNVALFDEQGAPHAVVCSENAAVRAWAEATVTSYRRRATRLDASALTV